MTASEGPSDARGAADAVSAAIYSLPAEDRVVLSRLIHLLDIMAAQIEALSQGLAGLDKLDDLRGQRLDLHAQRFDAQTQRLDAHSGTLDAHGTIIALLKDRVDALEAAAAQAGTTGLHSVKSPS
jgi:hypothetical protein